MLQKLKLVVVDKKIVHPNKLHHRHKLKIEDADYTCCTYAMNATVCGSKMEKNIEVHEKVPTFEFQPKSIKSFLISKRMNTEIKKFAIFY